MRRRDVASGLLAALTLALLCGCAVPESGRATYQPAAIGSLAGTGAGKPTATPAHRRAAHRRTSRPRHSPPPPAPTTTAAPTYAPPPATSAPPTRAPQPRRTDRPDGHRDQPTASLPEFAVCLSFYQLAREPNSEFRRLPADATHEQRTQVAGSYSRAYTQMIRVLQRSGLPRRDVVYARGSDVATAMSRIAQELPTGSGVSNHDLRTAFLALTQACAR